MNCEYVKQHYGVPAEIGMRIKYDGMKGIIAKDGGHYICANMDEHKPTYYIYIHPCDPNLEYLDEIGEIREEKLTRSQQKYRDYLNSAYYDAGDSFATFLGIDSK